jgi:hypothetical protein
MTSVDCSETNTLGVNPKAYLLGHITTLDILACTVEHSFCIYTDTLTLSDGLGTLPAPGISGFATVTKNTNGTFKIVLN